jgi:hypothetical protein
VLGKVSYTFSFTTNLALVSTEAQDYFALTFPKDFFEGHFTDYSDVTCNAPCTKIYMFGISNEIYMKVSLAATTAVTITINNIVNPAYSRDGIVSITGRTINDAKID